MGDSCDHGVEEGAFCMLCCREGEGKPASPEREEPRTFEECMTEPEPWAGG
jgi:hypothetical protein